MPVTTAFPRIAAIAALFAISTLAQAEPVATPEGICCMPSTGAPKAEATASPTRKTGHSTVMNFEGLEDLETVEDFYNGGTGGNGSGPGTDFGVTFSSNAQAIIDSDAGGSGNFGGEPSPDTILFFLSGTAATMNVPGGFTSGFSFFYSAINNPGQIVVYDGPDATGNVLATLNLPLTPHTGAPDPNGQFSPFEPIGVTFSGTARSVDFGGTIDQIGFDDITLGSATPGDSGPPPPASASLENIPTLNAVALALLAVLLGTVGIVGFRR